MTSGVVDTVVPGGDVDVFAVVVDEVDVEVLVVVVDVVEDCVVVTVVVSVTGLGFARVIVTAVPTSMRPGSGDCLMTVPSGSSLRAVSVTTGSLRVPNVLRASSSLIVRRSPSDTFPDATLSETVSPSAASANGAGVALTTWFFC